jgi:hypothetical protein
LVLRQKARELSGLASVIASDACEVEEELFGLPGEPDGLTKLTNGKLAQNALPQTFERVPRVAGDLDARDVASETLIDHVSQRSLAYTTFAIEETMLTPLVYSGDDPL